MKRSLELSSRWNAVVIAFLNLFKDEESPGFAGCGAG